VDSQAVTFLQNLKTYFGEKIPQPKNANPKVTVTLDPTSPTSPEKKVGCSVTFT